MDRFIHFSIHFYSWLFTFAGTSVSDPDPDLVGSVFGPDPDTLQETLIWIRVAKIVINSHTNQPIL